MVADGLEIIGAGMGRTGTESLRKALMILGYDPCHHMYALREDAALVPPWHAIAHGGAPDWDQLFQGFRAQVDWPGAAYWRELTAHFPNAKVVLSLRDADGWYNSLASTILPFIDAKGRHAPPHRNQIAELTEALFDRIFDGRVRDADHAKSVFIAHNEAVTAAIPTDRLLVYPVGSGWGPLCDFVSRPIPDQPFPSGNTARQFQERVARNLMPE